MLGTLIDVSSTSGVQRSTTLKNGNGMKLLHIPLPLHHAARLRRIGASAHNKTINMRFNMIFAAILPWAGVISALVLPDAHVFEELTIHDEHANETPSTLGPFPSAESIISAFQGAFEGAFDDFSDLENYLYSDGPEIIDSDDNKDVDSGAGDGAEKETIYQLISTNQHTKRFAKLLDEYDDLVDLLNSTKANYTLFVPVDEAFPHIPGGKKPSKRIHRERAALSHRPRSISGRQDPGHAYTADGPG